MKKHTIINNILKINTEQAIQWFQLDAGEALLMESGNMGSGQNPVKEVRHEGMSSPHLQDGKVVSLIFEERGKGSGKMES